MPITWVIILCLILRGDNMKKDKQFWDIAKVNNATMQYYYNRMVELSISAFEWVNLPSTVDQRYLELLLFSNGQAVFFNDEDIGYLALANASGGPFNVYGIPIIRHAYSKQNNYQKELTEKDSVLIYNNYTHTTNRLVAELYARRLWDLDRTIDINARAQKTPIAILCDENERLTMQQVYQKFDGNQPVIFGKKSINLSDIKAINTSAPYVADKLQELKTNLWNEALTALGITNVSITKKERLVTDEVMRSQGGTIASRYSRLQARRDACKAINEMFGLNIMCNFRDTDNNDSTNEMYEPTDSIKEEA